MPVTPGKPQRTLRLLAALSLALALGLACAGCGEDEPPAAQPGEAAPSPCRLITRAEAAQALGRQVREGLLQEPASPLGQRICLYRSADGDRLGYVQLSVVDDRAMAPGLKASGYDAAQLYRDSKELMGQAGRPVEGLGREAFWGGGQGLAGGAGLHVLAQGVYLNLFVSSGRPEEDRATARRLAELALERLAS
jgi:hypothetical protein